MCFVLLWELVDLIGRNLRLVEIAFVPNQHKLAFVLVQVRVKVVYPFSEIDKRLSVIQIKDQKDALGAPIIGFGDCPELFLASRVPNGNFDDFTLEIELSGYEINPESGGWVFGFFFLIGVDDRSFAHTRVANQDKFYHVFAICIVLKVGRWFHNLKI